MITRPLDLASKLRPEPRSFDALFYVNAGLLVLFFAVFGSRFVLAPGLGLELPVVEGSNQRAESTTDFITVSNAGQILAGDGPRDLKQLRGWLQQQVQLRQKQRRAPTLLVTASANVPNATVNEITAIAYATGFTRVILATAEPAGASPSARH